MLKNGYSNFELHILEYCDSDKVLQREQCYIDLLYPEYNMCKIAGSSRDFKHSEETIAKMSILAKARTLTTKQKASRLNALKVYYSSKEYKEDLKKLHMKKSRSILVYDTLENKTTIQSSIVEAASFIKCDRRTVQDSLKYTKEKGVSNPEGAQSVLQNGRLIKKRYLVYYNDKLKVVDYSNHELIRTIDKPVVKRVEILDILNNQTSVHLSISDAALAIGCNQSTVSRCLSHNKANGVSRLIKKQFEVKYIND